MVDPAAPEFERKVIGLIAKKKKLDPATITPASTFQELGIDSLDGIDLVFTFEDEFNISIPDQVVQKMKSVGQVIEALREVLAKRTPSA
jgi:acyl carrier protein